MNLENAVDINVTLEEAETIGVEIQEAGPPGEKGEPGLSAYEVYLSAGGTLSEVEWLDSLKGEKGKDGIDGKNGENGKDGEDGYTPVKGTDYWTKEEQKEIKKDLQNYFDEQLGVIENGTY